MTEINHRARVAGVLYLAMSAAAVVALRNVPAWTMEGGDATAVADGIAAAPFAYRIGILCDLAAQVLFVFLVLALHHLFDACGAPSFSGAMSIMGALSTMRENHEPDSEALRRRMLPPMEWASAT